MPHANECALMQTMSDRASVISTEAAKAPFFVAAKGMSRKDLIDIKVILRSTECDPREEFVRHPTCLRVAPPLLPNGQVSAKMFFDLAVHAWP